MDPKHSPHYVDTSDSAVTAEPEEAKKKINQVNFLTKSPFQIPDFSKAANSTMDDLDAPQWADFIAPSPHVGVDDFFLRKHEHHEYRSKSEFADSDLSPNLSIKQPLNESSINDTVYEKTPKKSSIMKGKNSSCKKSKIKQITYESALTEAMNNLQLSFKMMKADSSISKSCLIDSPTTYAKTPKRVTRSMCAQAATPKHLDESHYHSLEQVNSDEDEHVHIEENKENIDTDQHIEDNGKPNERSEVEECIKAGEQTRLSTQNEEKHEQELESTSSEQINLEVTATSTEPDSSNDKLEPEPQSEPNNAVNDDKPQQLPKSKIVTSFNLPTTAPTTSGTSLKKKPTALTGNAWHRQVKRRISLTNQRRLSLTKALVGNKYVSMAEAVTKFQRATPQRFHTINEKKTKTESMRRQSFKLTKAMSPALMCKNRARPTTVLSREEKEKIELEKIRQNQIKANPVRVGILKKPAPLKKVEKKMITNPEPFHLTKTKKEQLPQSKPNQIQEFKRTHKIASKTVPTVVIRDEHSVTVKEEEVLHFGIPLEPVNMKKKTTKIKPFSFEARNRELEEKKKEKLKLLKESEQQKVKAEFHARPVPAAVKTPCNTKLMPKAASANKPKKITIARSLSFEERNKQAQKRKEEKIKQMLEEEKKLRTFKAQKVPEFKPVLVKGRSKDNLLKRSNENLSGKSQSVSLVNKKTDNSLKKSNENLTSKMSNSMPAMKKSNENLVLKNLNKKPIPFVAPKVKKTPPSTVTENQENKNQGAIPKILEPKCKLSQKSIAVLSELNTDKRAKQRKEFEEQIKKKLTNEEELKKKEEQERLEREKAENMELRKKREIKARPMPVYKPMNIVKSNKPLTEAQSPHWAKPKTRSSLH